MKPFSNELATLFDTNTFVSADLYTFALANGGIAYLTSHDTPLSWGAVTYSSGNPRIDRSAISQKTGLQVSSVKINVYPTANDTILGITWLNALRRGMFDGATVQIDRAFGPAWGQALTGTVTMLKGRVADATFGRTKAEIEVNSWTELLSNQMPRTYFQSACNNTLYDARCTVPRYAYAVAGEMNVVNSAYNFLTFLPQPQGWFAYGVITMTSGICQGETRPIGFNSGPFDYGNDFQLQIPFSVPPNSGDSFVAYAGCDKTMNTCANKFYNLPHFTGFPFIPAPETAV